MTLSQLDLEDVEALCLEPSFLMADPMGPLLDHDEEALSPSLKVKAPASPSLSFSSYTSSSPYQTLSYSPLSSGSPPPSPPPTHSSSFLGTKAETDLLSFSLLGASDLLDAHVRADDGKDDPLEGMDWMSEKIDLSDFDLDSLIGSCSSESPSSPEDLLTSLDTQVDLDTLETPIDVQPNDDDVDLMLPGIPTLQVDTSLLAEVEAPVPEVVVKSEPASPSCPAFTLELGSEVDVQDAEKTASSLTATIIQDPSRILQASNPIVLSIPTSGHFVVVLANEGAPSLPDQSIEISQSSDCESDSGIESVVGSPARHPSPPLSSPTSGSSRTKPYCKPEPTASPSPKAPKVKSVSGAPKVEKKLKKMEQNKTAATRYRQKKRVEQELLNVECDELEKKNHELKEKADSIGREIQYLKDLMEEVRKHHRGKTSSVA
ncbi:cyclic AMP-dependent transcription factor ATF-4 isoform 1-T1 [Menidia menidia]